MINEFILWFRLAIFVPLGYLLLIVMSIKDITLDSSYGIRSIIDDEFKKYYSRKLK